MPTSLSAKKRLRQNETRRLQNRSIKTSVRGTIRKVREAIEKGEIEEAESQFRLACKKLDRAGARNIIHPNTAARSKSRLSARIKAAKQAGA